MRDGRSVRVAAVGDLHCTRSSQGKLRPLLSELGESADIVALCGDLTDYGLPEEAEVLAHELGAVKAPVVAVLGNHDHESGQHQAVVAALAEAGVKVLDGESVEIEGVGFAGTKGFGGGFGERALGPWGEDAIKAFVQEAVSEALKLETALARLRTAARVVLLHYAPVEDTVRGEPPAIYPFLGSSRLEEPIDRFNVTAVFHGHAHHGSPEGRTKGGVPVYNVAVPLLRRDSERPPFRIVEVATEAPAEVETSEVG